ncbi:MAG: alpha/beta hydrolase [Brevundimonas sp.]|uniref:alpha/beta hydrolase n=1 Tax=Brevundimonas sp. TaxID=1871086 RepID=UPI0027160A20|nr:alpha/beta hydrolase [Brevundimonas sp.]MDO9586714.1 alpha/beta hydrolase [Brevundimonas sp.]MDP3369517.1 alpha/beta hydrolase [Brevundimonas sp.]MDP3658137.1 alpha/beta hydrolase [Brevundimonas sp.]MDZ4109691.1 alpha/beta hydrolase [Brevundimonas sp.]
MTGKSDGIDLESEYNNRARVPDHPAVMQRWRETAAAARAARPPLEIAYGPGPREVMDLFEAAPDAPVAVFLHGGYWQALDKGWFSGLAPALAAHGVSLAIPSYDLCPTVRLGVILRQVRSAVETVRERTGVRPVVFGHSAGGHMAACMLSEGRASAAVAISGVFDLRPLIPTSLNTALDLDEREASALSPIFWPVPNGSTPGGTVLDCLVGADESPEFLRQSKTMAGHWAANGVEARYEALPGLNHFTVLDPLFDTDSGLVRRIAALAVKSGA